jgi:hypothetical protein
VTRPGSLTVAARAVQATVATGDARRCGDHVARAAAAIARVLAVARAAAQHVVTRIAHGTLIRAPRTVAPTLVVDPDELAVSATRRRRASDASRAPVPAGLVADGGARAVAAAGRLAGAITRTATVPVAHAVGAARGSRPAAWRARAAAVAVVEGDAREEAAAASIAGPLAAAARGPADLVGLARGRRRAVVGAVATASSLDARGTAGRVRAIDTTPRRPAAGRGAHALASVLDGHRVGISVVWRGGVEGGVHLGRLGGRVAGRRVGETSGVERRRRIGGRIVAGYARVAPGVLETSGAQAARGAEQRRCGCARQREPPGPPHEVTSTTYEGWRRSWPLSRLDPGLADPRPRRGVAARRSATLGDGG